MTEWNSADAGRLRRAPRSDRPPSRPARPPGPRPRAARTIGLALVGCLVLVGLVVAFGAHAVGSLPTGPGGTATASPHAADGTGLDGGENGTGNGTVGDHETENATGPGSDQPPGETENDTETPNGSSEALGDPGNDSAGSPGNASDTTSADGDSDENDTGEGNASADEGACPGPIVNRSAEPDGGNVSYNGSENASSVLSWNDGSASDGQGACPYATQGDRQNGTGENSSTIMPENSTADPEEDPLGGADPPTSTVPGTGTTWNSLATGRLTVPFAVVGVALGGLSTAFVARHGLRGRR